MKKWLSKNLVGFGLASFLNDVCHEMTTAILPAYIHHIVGSAFAPLALGFIEGISDAAATAMKLLSGLLADRLKYYKPFLILGYGITGIFIALIGTTQSIVIIALYKTIAWMARGLREPMRDTWLSKIVDPKFYGRAFGFERSLDTLGAFVGPVGTFLLLQWGFSLPSIFFVALIPGALSVLPIIFLTHESEEQTKNAKITFQSQFHLLPNNFKLFLFVMFLFGIANFHQALFLYRAQALLGIHEASTIMPTLLTVLLYALFNAVRGLSEMGMGTLSDYVNRKNLLAVFGIGFFGITCIGFMSSSENLLFWSCLFACAGFSAGTVKALEKAHAATLLPENVRGVGMGVLQTIDGVGDLISSLIVGGIWTLTSPMIGFMYAALLSFIAMGILLKQNVKK